MVLCRGDDLASSEALFSIPRHARFSNSRTNHCVLGRLNPTNAVPHVALQPLHRYGGYSAPNPSNQRSPSRPISSSHMVSNLPSINLLKKWPDIILFLPTAVLILLVPILLVPTSPARQSSGPTVHATLQTRSHLLRPLAHPGSTPASSHHIFGLPRCLPWSRQAPADCTPSPSHYQESLVRSKL